MSHSAEKGKRRDFFDFQTWILLQNNKKLKGGPFGDNKKFGICLFCRIPFCRIPLCRKHGTFSSGDRNSAKWARQLSKSANTDFLRAKL